MKVERIDKKSGSGMSELSLGGKEIKPECVSARSEERFCQKTNELRAKIKKAIEANDLCYNCETGFHYMKQ
ncbi:hypothetical protein Desor_4057 [Desulfosporosinus orientis DSM 765]|uniref:Uncharacterized protein n=1 Tax=Desulfosporosinus orientis (strain ATCC 19365 / DSM 765 / NCIMB 8382 / VKM B-1628 / Singapore I) TaxID=768706 RepID=G7WFY4_DESOD|nr:hypothetical protein [Desulfosporosinus orientis]AET69499.1 hypothetical protein Desor_4057 [Desulfosporosinus orientis DSM 765]